MKEKPMVTAKEILQEKTFLVTGQKILAIIEATYYRDWDLEEIATFEKAITACIEVEL